MGKIFFWIVLILILLVCFRRSKLGTIFLVVGAFLFFSVAIIGAILAIIGLLLILFGVW